MTIFKWLLSFTMAQGLTGDHFTILGYKSADLAPESKISKTAEKLEAWPRLGIETVFDFKIQVEKNKRLISCSAARGQISGEEITLRQNPHCRIDNVIQLVALEPDSVIYLKLNQLKFECPNCETTLRKKKYIGRSLTINTFDKQLIWMQPVKQGTKSFDRPPTKISW